MVEMVTTQPPKFTTIIYETKDGEKISATKKDGIVTLVGDKNGVRQMELDKFIKEELPNNVKNFKLENSPEKDTVEISKPAKEENKQPAPAAAQLPKETEKANATNPIAPASKPEEKAPVAPEVKAEEKAQPEPKKIDVVA